MLFDSVTALIGGEATDVIHECRRCGTTVEAEVDQCPRCGPEATVVQYEID